MIDGSGIIGLFITFFIYFGISVLDGFIFYTYIVFLHMDGRMVDLYTRVSAGKDNFFIPYDNEISARALRQLLERIKRENDSLKGTPGMKHVSITNHEVGNGEKSSYIALYEKCFDGRLELYRHFFRMSNGSICELEQQLIYTVDDYPLFEKGPPDHKRRLMTTASNILADDCQDKEKQYLDIGKQVEGMPLTPMSGMPDEKKPVQNLLEVPEPNATVHTKA